MAAFDPPTVPLLVPDHGGRGVPAPRQGTSEGPREPGSTTSTERVRSGTEPPRAGSTRKAVLIGLPILVVVGLVVAAVLVGNAVSASTIQSRLQRLSASVSSNPLPGCVDQLEQGLGNYTLRGGSVGPAKQTFRAAVAQAITAGRFTRYDFLVGTYLTTEAADIVMQRLNTNPVLGQCTARWKAAQQEFGLALADLASVERPDLYQQVDDSTLAALAAVDFTPSSTMPSASLYRLALRGFGCGEETFDSMSNRCRG